MSELRPFPVVLENGETATMYATARFLDDRQERLIRMKDGREFLVPKSALVPRSDGSFDLRMPPDELGTYDRLRPASAERGQRTTERQQDQRETRDMPEGGSIPVIEEEVEVRKREHEIGRVRIQKSVETREAKLEESLIRREFHVERIPVDKVIDSPVEPWYDGDTLVLPVYEEVLVVEKRLVLREEIRVTRRIEERVEHQTVPVRREHVDVERVR
jgi:uncharacterized protein (TIGR02271 family)